MLYVKSLGVLVALAALTFGGVAVAQNSIQGSGSFRSNANGSIQGSGPDIAPVLTAAQAQSAALAAPGQAALTAAQAQSAALAAQGQAALQQAASGTHQVNGSFASSSQGSLQGSSTTSSNGGSFHGDFQGSMSAPGGSFSAHGSAQGSMNGSITLPPPPALPSVPTLPPPPPLPALPPPPSGSVEGSLIGTLQGMFGGSLTAQ